MKKLNLSLVTVLAMSTFAFAGGDIAPVEPMIETPMVEEAVSTPGSFYLGLAYGAANWENTYEETRPDGTTVYPTSDVDYSTIMLQAGYKFNPYIAVEGRYWIGMDEDYINRDGFGADLNIDTWGIYVKPMYPVTEQFDIYGLLGYASTQVEVSYPAYTYEPDYDLDGFSWGIGGAYSFTENLAVFVDYVNMYDDSVSVDYATFSASNDEILQTVNFGVTYTF